MHQPIGYRWRIALLTLITAAAVLSLSAAATQAQVPLGPQNPGAEDGNTNWFSGASGTGHTTIDTTDPHTGTSDFELGVAAPGPGNADWRSAAHLLLGPSNLGQPVDISFWYKIPGTVAAGDNLRLDLRFFQTPGGGVFLGEHNIFLGTASGDSNMNAYRQHTTTGIVVPANAQSFDIRFSGNLFGTWTSGTARFDDFAVTTVPEPATGATISGLASLLLAARMRRRA